MDSLQIRSCLVVNLAPEVTKEDITLLASTIARINPRLIRDVGMFSINMAEMVKFQPFDRNRNFIPLDRFLSAVMIEGVQRIAITQPDV